jgi:hypothetical protein
MLEIGGGMNRQLSLSSSPQFGQTKRRNSRSVKHIIAFAAQNAGDRVGFAERAAIKRQF